MRLLFIGPDNEFTAKVKLVLRRHQGLTMLEAPYPEASPQYFEAPLPDLVMMISHPNIVHWTLTLQRMNWRGPCLLLLRPVDYRLADKLLENPQIECMPQENLELPFFPRLLERLATRSHASTALLADPPLSIQDQAFMNTLSAMIASLTQSLDPDTVLDRLLAALFKLIPCDAADIRLVNGDDVVMTRSSGYPDFLAPKSEPLHYSLQATRNLREGAAEHRAVLVDDTRAYKGWITRPGSDWIRTHLTAPLFLDNVLVGFLNVSGTRPHTFDSSHVQALEMLAPLATVALHNAQLYHSLSLERDQLMFLANIDQKILTMSDSPQIVMQTILGHALRLLGLTKGISILNAELHQPDFVHTRGIRNVEETRQLIIANWDGDYRLYEEQGPGWYHTTETRATFPPRFAKWAEDENIEAMLSMPLWLHGRLVGKIMLFHTTPRQWKDREIQMIQRLASQAAIAIDKATLTQKLRQRLREAESLNRVLQAAGTTLDAEQILGNICVEAKHILQVPCVSASLLQDDGVRRVHEVYDLPYSSASSEKIVLTSGYVLAQALRANQPLIFQDSQKDAPSWLRELLSPITRSALLVPLLMREAPAGFILAESPSPHPFTEELHLMALIAAAMTPTLENAGLFQQIQETRAETEAAYGELRRLDALKSQFIQNVSHEFRTPLAIVKGYVDLIVEGALGVETSSDLMPAVRAIHTHTNNLVRLVESITTLEDAEVGKLLLVSQPIQPICRAALKANWQKALRREIEILSALPDDLPPLAVDAEGLLRALNQILDNAIKFSERSSRIWFNVLLQEEHVCLRVRDEGIGIPESELSRVFDRFYQINGATTRRHGGMGLGLSLVREVVQRHGGSVWAESPGEGLGTTITMLLPLESGKPRPTATRVEPALMQAERKN